MDNLINYTELAQKAMLQVVKNALEAVIDNGGVLPGDHHFYITFHTGHKRVRMSTDLRKRFPEKMTIVIQRQYRDLQVHDDDFEVTLKFAGMPQNLVIPFASLTDFSDPYANFRVTFNPSIDNTSEDRKFSEESTAYDNLDNVVSFEKFRRR